MPLIAIAGAGIGGLTAALALAEVGCRVDVYEQAPGPTETGAGVQLSPNASVVLDRLGILGGLRAASVELAEVVIRRARDGAALARIPLGPGAATRYGAPFLVTLRADLHGALTARVAETSAVRLHFGAAVAGCDIGQLGVLIRFADARLAPKTADGFVAADGIRSVIRRQREGAGSDDAKPSGRSAWRSLVPRDAADADVLRARSNLWLGRRAHLVHYPIDGARQVNVVAVVDDGMTKDADGFWSTPGDAAVIAARFADWAAPARRLIAAAPNWRRWPLFDRPVLDRWSFGPTTLLGDAAHPMLPFLAQGAAQAIEDAAVLAGTVSRSPDNLSEAFLVYERLRLGRTSRIQLESRRQGLVYHLGPPASLIRDLAFAMIGSGRLAARYDWLYDAPSEVRHFAQP